jgi:hypothetical protein
LLKNGHLWRFPHPSSLRRTAKYASFLRISGALHLTIFEQPEKDDFFSSLLEGAFPLPTGRQANAPFNGVTPLPVRRPALRDEGRKITFYRI